MRTALDTPASELDAEERAFVDTVRTHGWCGTHVREDAEGPGFSYTTGLWLSLGKPEIIVFSLKPEVAHRVLWNVYRSFSAGYDLPPGEPAPEIFEGGVSAVLMPVARSQYAEHLGWTRWFYDHNDFPCGQLVWPDSGGRFPWDAGFAPDLLACQPDLSNGAWP